MITILPVAFLLSALQFCCDSNDESSDEPIKVTVLVILGSEQDKYVNPRLKEIAPELRKKDNKLIGFDLKKVIDQRFSMGQTKDIELVAKEKLKLTINEKTDDCGRATITIKLPMLDDITYACTCGKFFPILTNYYTEDKRRLIIAVMAKPCKTK